eukprot:Tbor_TRINITY_DN5419_c1_g5::TRINITY_DN5419_c1_g5_i1::g.25213::m.25213
MMQRLTLLRLIKLLRTLQLRLVLLRACLVTLRLWLNGLRIWLRRPVRIRLMQPLIKAIRLLLEPKKELFYHRCLTKDKTVKTNTAPGDTKGNDVAAKDRKGASVVKVSPTPVVPVPPKADATPDKG